MRLPTFSSLACSVSSLACSVAVYGLLAPAVCESAESKLIEVSPAKITLLGPESAQQLLVTTRLDGRRVDRTHRATYASSNVAIATVDSSGRVSPISEGQASITISVGGSKAVVPVEVGGIVEPKPVSFEHEIIPILSKARCNAGGCHGKAEGQNGFKLSVFGFDPMADFNAFTKEGRGRRVIVGAPERSLFLTKASGKMPHGGGIKIRRNSAWYRRISRWIQSGAQFDNSHHLPTIKIEVSPSSVLISAGEKQQLQVTSIDSEGNRRCVTAEAEFETNADPIAGVDEHGVVSVTGVPGEAAILVRYMGHVATCRVTLPQKTEFTRPAENNFIDKLVWNKLERLGIQPSQVCDDATFLRRVSLDLTGTLPSVDHAKQFLGDQSPDKRAKLIARLFKTREYADYQAMRWADILRVDKDRITAQGAVGMTRWLRKQFANNTPYDQFVRSIVLAKGNSASESPAAFFHAHKDAQEMARSVSQLFLGVRIECAQCHHHPFEKWGQEDYFAFAGFFTGVTKKKNPIGGTKVLSVDGKDFPHPRTKEKVAARALGAKAVEFAPSTDRRQVLADWMLARDNPFLARMIVNRLWSHYFGRGLVEPIDDMRETNPATNEPLLNALAKHLVEVNYDLQRLTTTMLTSNVYQLSAESNDSNRLDEQNFSHATWKAMPAEVLLDAICQATEIPEEFNGWPKGVRAIQIWDNRMPSYFFKVFGRPARVSVCECERGNEPSMAQALHLLNAEETSAKIRHRDGRARRLANSTLTNQEIVRELFLATLSRQPTDEELKLMLSAFEDVPNGRKSGTEDVLWALLNMTEFVYNR